MAIAVNPEVSGGGSGGAQWSDSTESPLSSSVSIWDAQVTSGDIGSARMLDIPSPYYMGAASADRDGWVVSQTAGGAGNLTLTGNQPAVPLEVSLYSTGNLSGVTFTVTGVDLFGAAQTEVIAGPNNTTKYGSKPFTSVSQVAVSGAVGTAVEVGWRDSDESKSIVHPSVVNVPEGWMGYRYWLAFTPYRSTNSSFENPCVVASNDFSTWIAPATNPIIPPTGVAAGYNSDPHLYLLPDKSKLLMMYRDSGVVSGYDRFFITETTDGVTWSPPVAIFTMLNSGGHVRYVSPSFFYDGSNWAIYAVDINAVGYPLKRLLRAGDVASIYTDWSAETPATCTMTNPRGETWWHSHIIRLSDGRLIGVASDNDSAGGQMWLIQSDNGTTFSVKETPFYANIYYRNSIHIECDPTGQANELVITAGLFGPVSPNWRFSRVSYPLIGKFTGRQSAVLSALGSYSLMANDRNDLILAADTFTGTGGTNVVTSSDGKSWTQYDGNNVQYSGSGYATNENTNNCRMWSDAGMSDVSVQLRFVTRTATGQGYVTFRLTDVDNYWRAGVSSAGVVVLQNIVAGAFGTVNAQIMTFADGMVMRVDADGARIQMFVNGRMVYAVNDTTHLNATKCGVQLLNSATPAGTLVDDFLVHKLS